MSLQSDFELKFPNLSPLNQDAFDSAVGDSGCIYGGSYSESGGCDNTIILYLVAHLYSISLRAVSLPAGVSPSPQREVSSKSAGGLSTSFVSHTSSNSEQFLNSTAYGQRYLLLISRRSGAFFV